MAFDSLDLLRVLQVTIVVLGIVILYFGTKSFRKTKSRSMLFLSIGFLFVTVGAVAAGLLFEFLNFDIYTVDAVGAACEVIGFLLIVYSIVGTRD